MSPFKLYVLRAFASDYHSGQWSRGYKILSMTWLRMKAKGILNTPNFDNNIEMARKTHLYQVLVDKYGDKI